MDELKSIKIMLLSPDFGYGGAEKSVASISILLSKFHEVHFVVFNRKIPQVYETGGTIHSLGVGAGGTLLQKIFNFFRRVNRLKRLKRELGIQICLSFLEGADYVNILSRNEERIIINIRGSKKFDPNISGLVGWIRRSVLIPKIYNKANALTAVTEQLRDELLNDFKIDKTKPFFVIPNFCNVCELQSSAKETISDQWESFFASSQVIVTVGRISYEKGLHLFVPVFKRILEVRPKTKWVIVGDGHYCEIIKEKLAEERIRICESTERIDFESSVFFVGYQYNPHKWVARSTVFVLTSLTEGFPNALLEAMAVGVTVVAADCPYGPSDILGHEEHSTYLRNYGILLPMLSNNGTVIDSWTACLIDLFMSERLLQEYAMLAIERSNHYSPVAIKKLWNKALITTLNEEKSAYH